MATHPVPAHTKNRDFCLAKAAWQLACASASLAGESILKVTLAPPSLIAAALPLVIRETIFDLLSFHVSVDLFINNHNRG